MICQKVLMLVFLLATLIKSIELTAQYDESTGEMHFISINENGILNDYGPFKKLPRNQFLLGGSNLWISEAGDLCVRTCVGCRELYPKFADLADFKFKPIKKNNHRRIYN